MHRGSRSKTNVEGRWSQLVHDRGDSIMASSTVDGLSTPINLSSTALKLGDCRTYTNDRAVLKIPR